MLISTYDVTGASDDVTGASYDVTGTSTGDMTPSSPCSDLGLGAGVNDTVEIFRDFLLPLFELACDIDVFAENPSE